MNHMLINSVLLVVLTLTSDLGAIAEDGDTKSIDIILVNDLEYGFYPVESNGDLCKDETGNNCLGGLARLAKTFEGLLPSQSTTTPETETSITTSSTTSTTTSPTTSPTTSSTTPSTTTTITSTTKDNSADSKSTEEDTSKPNTPADQDKSFAYALSDNTFLLNAGNYLYSRSNNWFDLLKFESAVEALEALQFTAIALGPDVFMYGMKMGSYLTSKLKEKVIVSNVEELTDFETSHFSFVKSITVPIDNSNKVTIIGFVDPCLKEVHVDGLKITNPVTAVQNEIERVKKEDGGSHTFIAIGPVGDCEDIARSILLIEDISLVLISGRLRSNLYVDGEMVLTVNKTEGCPATLYSTEPAESATSPHRLGYLKLSVDENGCASLKNHNISDYFSDSRTTNTNILEIEKKGMDALRTIKETAVAQSEIDLGEISCIGFENVWGNLVADAIQESIEDEETKRITIWRPEYNTYTIKAGTNITEEMIYKLLGSQRDQNMYAVDIEAKSLLSILEENIETKENLKCESFQTSGLYVEYGDWAEKGMKIQKLSILAPNKTFLELNWNKKNNTVRVIVPGHMLKLLLTKGASHQDLGMTVEQAVMKYICPCDTGLKSLRFSPLGFRYESVEAPPHCGKCKENTAEAVILTLAVITIIVGLSLLTWYFIIPRIRQRRGSTMPLIY